MAAGDSPFESLDESPAMEQALDWLVTVWSREASEAQLQALAQWRASSAENEQAWQTVQRIDRKVRAVPAPIADATLRPRPTVSRRALLRSLGGLVIAAPVAYALHESPIWKLQFADYAARVGERREIRLPDGTRLILNSGSAINVLFDALARRVIVEAGEIFVETAADPRPLLIETRHGHARPIGTRFVVRQMLDHSSVSVLEGAVQITPAASDDTLRVDAGQRALFDAKSVRLAPNDAMATSWMNGLLVAERMRLGDFLDELSRYRSGLIQCAPAVRDKIVTGVFPTDDSDRVLQALAESLGLSLRYRTRYWVVVGP